MFNEMDQIPFEDRWHGQAHPAPIVVALIARLVGESDEKQLLLIKRKKRPFINQWALVGGKWDFGETLETAVAREVFEETGVTCELTAVRGMVNERLLSPEASNKAAHFLLFVCELAVLSGEACEQNEGAVGWFSLDQIDKLAKEQRIIPSDYKMICQFGKTPVSMPLIEADMLRHGDDATEKPAELVKFERINQSLKLAKPFLNTVVDVVMDRPMGSKHPAYGFDYPVNYGYIPNVLAPDGEALDAYVLAVKEPLKRFNGRCIAIIHRLDDDDDKLVVVPDGTIMSNDEIMEAVAFQEQFFNITIIR